MRAARLAMLPMLFAVASCAEWERPGATPQQRDAALARCEAAAYSKMPAELVTVQTDAGGWVPARRECRGEGDRRRCTETAGYYRQPSYGQRDQNRPAREAMVSDCMRRDGWVLR
ncbi:hypothetical protein ACE7GA_04955 [Roseomonas sp. CCTCC AB2023176]|uniref:hypothetical protein n=1 Tax=Roseomonas sp. CCTCC AB2023176 TaxID=3342640 RepID=UPI0035D5A516